MKNVITKNRFLLYCILSGFCASLAGFFAKIAIYDALKDLHVFRLVWFPFVHNIGQPVVEKWTGKESRVGEWLVGRKKTNYRFSAYKQSAPLFRTEDKASFRNDLLYKRAAGYNMRLLEDDKIFSPILSYLFCVSHTLLQAFTNLHVYVNYVYSCDEDSGDILNNVNAEVLSLFLESSNEDIGQNIIDTNYSYLLENSTAFTVFNSIYYQCCPGFFTNREKKPNVYERQLSGNFTLDSIPEVNKYYGDKVIKLEKNKSIKNNTIAKYSSVDYNVYNLMNSLNCNDEGNLFFKIYTKYFFTLIISILIRYLSLILSLTLNSFMLGFYLHALALSESASRAVVMNYAANFIVCGILSKIDSLYLIVKTLLIGGNKAQSNMNNFKTNTSTLVPFLDENNNTRSITNNTNIETVQRDGRFSFSSFLVSVLNLLGDSKGILKWWLGIGCMIMGMAMLSM